MLPGDRDGSQQDQGNSVIMSLKMVKALRVQTIKMTQHSKGLWLLITELYLPPHNTQKRATSCFIKYQQNHLTPVQIL